MPVFEVVFELVRAVSLRVNGDKKRHNFVLGHFGSVCVHASRQAGVNS